jgi:hypothetical protein
MTLATRIAEQNALATPGERHTKCGRMVAYGELHWTDECIAVERCVYCGATAVTTDTSDFLVCSGHSDRTMNVWRS